MSTSWPKHVRLQHTECWETLIPTADGQACSNACGGNIPEPRQHRLCLISRTAAGVLVGSARGVSPQNQIGHGVWIQHELSAAL